MQEHILWESICGALEGIALELHEIKEILARQETKKEEPARVRMVRIRKPKKIFEL